MVELGQTKCDHSECSYACVLHGIGPTVVAEDLRSTVCFESVLNLGIESVVIQIIKYVLGSIYLFFYILCYFSLFTKHAGT